jgi:hypothetical protein
MTSKSSEDMNKKSYITSNYWKTVSYFKVPIVKFVTVNSLDSSKDMHWTWMNSINECESSLFTGNYMYNVPFPPGNYNSIFHGRDSFQWQFSSLGRRHVKIIFM